MDGREEKAISWSTLDYPITISIIIIRCSLIINVGNVVAIYLPVFQGNLLSHQIRSEENTLSKCGRRSRILSPVAKKRGDDLGEFISSSLRADNINTWHYYLQRIYMWR